MKKLFLSFTLLALSSIQAFEYNPIQQAIVDRDPDKLEELLKAKTLTPAEKFIYLDLVEQIILDQFLPPIQRAFKPKPTNDVGIAAIAILASYIGLLGSVFYGIHTIETHNTAPVGAALVFGGSIVTLIGSTLYLTIADMNLQSQSNANSVKIKQMLLAA
jgi:hypothetical protein